MKKILIISKSFWNIYNFRKELLEKLKNDFSIIAYAKNDDYKINLEKKNIKTFSANLHNRKFSPLSDLHYLFKLINIIRLERPDLVLNFNLKPIIYGNILSNIFNIKTISNITGIGSSFLGNIFTKLLVKTLYKISFKKENHIFFQNKEDHIFFLKNKIVSKKHSNYDILPGSGVNLLVNEYSEIPKRSNINFILISRLIKDKGVNEFIEVAQIIKKKYNHIYFTIIGDIEDSNESRKLLKKIKKLSSENILNYLGFKNKVNKYIQESDCVVLPSYREGLSRVLLEGMSVGRPIITTNVPGCRELVNGNGYLAEPRSISSLLYYTNQFINLDYLDKLKMGKLSRAVVERHYNVDIIIQKYIQTINQKLK